MVAIFGTVLLLRAILSPPTAETALNNLADTYYQENILTSEKKMNSYTLVVKNLKKLGFDTSEFDSYGCSDNSRVIVQITNPQETDASKITYQTETVLVDCQD